MLIELSIENYATIERLTLRPGAGLSALTGETGAGKSIIVGALSLMLGERASSDVVRTGASRATIDGVFDVAGNAAVQALLSEAGIEPEDGLLLLRREIAAQGRSRAWVNGVPATAALVGSLGGLLVDLHGQHEFQTLLRARDQLDILDAYAGATEAAKAVAARHEAVRAARAALDALEARRRNAEQKAEFLRFQVEEIERVAPRPGELDELEAEARRLDHAEELARLAGRLDDELYSSEHAVAARLAELRKTLAQLARIDPSQEPLSRSLDEAFYAVQEIGRQMGDYRDSVEHDPARLDQIRRRQDALARLQTKYGESIEEILDAQAHAQAELDLIDGAAFERQALEQQLDAARREYEAAARALTEARTAAAGKLETAMSALLPQLGLVGGQFFVVLTPLERPGASGAETTEFRVALNAGLGAKPLAKVASGGELSRVMLALKTVLAEVDRVATLVFDEVDAGVGGRVAHQVADRLAEVGQRRQVFVITHLAQVAARAEHHLLVEKATNGGVTSSDVRTLEGEERVREIARMLSGEDQSKTALAHARELIGAER